MSRSRSHLLPPGARIGRNVTVLGTVDGGGKDPVYIAWHHRNWCPVACKVFRSHRRAEREAHVLRALSHPYTVRLLGLERPGLLLMEFVEGPTLSRLIDEARFRRLGVSDAVRVAIHLAAALQHIHERGYLHLDVKPANVLVTRGGRPILFDFGSARPIGGRRPSYVVGTDPYIAPEECRLEAVTPAADVFSLGVSLYEMLTGEYPFGKGSRADPFPQTHARPVPARKHRSSLRGGLDDLLLACLSQAPSDRPSLSELIPRLHDFIVAGPKMWPPGFEPAPKPQRTADHEPRRAA